jgi:hypothetical protein
MFMKEDEGSTVLFKPGPPPGLHPYYLDVGTSTQPPVHL